MRLSTWEATAAPPCKAAATMVASVVLVVLVAEVAATALVVVVEAPRITIAAVAVAAVSVQEHGRSRGCRRHRRKGILARLSSW